MDMDFWHQKWKTNDIAFHEGDANPLLVRYLDALALPPGSRLFLPLCGKTRDIAWLLAQGFRVAGAELSALAVDQLFDELQVKPAITPAGALTHYQAANIDLFSGDVFDLSRTVLGPVDAVFDRAALVALPQAMRAGYVAHLEQLTGKAKQLLICYEYDQAVMPGPPFSVDADEVRQLYRAFDARLLGSLEVVGGLKRRVAAEETVWLLHPLPSYPDR